MDKRSLWIGLGSGMIVGAVLLQLAMVGQNALSESSLDPELATANLTKEQLEAAAKSMDMKLVASDDELYTEAEWVNKKKQESSELQGKTATAPEATDSAVKPEQPDDPSNLSTMKATNRTKSLSQRRSSRQLLTVPKLRLPYLSKYVQETVWPLWRGIWRKPVL